MQESFPFFVGAGRSGTTLVRAIFDSHPALAIPPEAGYLVPRLARQRSRYETGDGFAVEAFVDDAFHRNRVSGQVMFERWELTPDEIRNALVAEGVTLVPDAVRLLYSLYAKKHGKSLYGDKTPAYVSGIPVIAALLPEAKIVHIIRDGRNVALSQTEEKWGPRNFEQAVWRWKVHVERGRKAGSAIGPQRYREMRYEDLLADPEGTVRSLCSFLGLSFDEAMLRYHERADKVIAQLRSAHPNIARPPSATRDWRHQLTATQRAYFDAVAGGLAADLGYERSHSGLLAKSGAAIKKYAALTAMSAHHISARARNRL